MGLVGVVVNAVGTLLLPIALAVVAVRATRGRVAWLVAGAIAFVGSQIVHMPILWAWDALTRGGALPPPGPLPRALLLGLLAGLVEEPARAIVFLRVFPRERGRDAALVVGVGHGGIEALVVGAVALLGAINALVLSGMTEADLVAQGLSASDAAAALAQVHAAEAAPMLDALAGLVERAVTIPFHVACSLLVAAAVRRRNVVPFLVALAAHTTTDALAVVVVDAGHSAWLIEGELALFVVPYVVAVGYWAVRSEPRREANEAASSPAPAG